MRPRTRRSPEPPQREARTPGEPAVSLPSPADGPSPQGEHRRNSHRSPGSAGQAPGPVWICGVPLVSAPSEASLFFAD